MAKRSQRKRRNRRRESAVREEVRKSKWDLDLENEVARMFDRARTSDGQSAPRKHHLVPRSYLERWSIDSKLRVTHVNDRRSYVTSPEKAARETDYYRLESEDLDPEQIPHLLFETILGTVEGAAKSGIDVLLGDPGSFSPMDAFELAGFMALQVTRGERWRATHRTLVTETTKIQLGSGSRQQPDGERAQLLTDLEDGTLEVRPQDAQTIGLGASIAQELVPSILLRHWVLFTTPSVMVTSDEPVVTIGGPGTHRGQRAGLGSAAVLMFPLSPSRLLALFRDDVGTSLGYDTDAVVVCDHLDLGETHELCRETVMASSRWVFERPDKSIGTSLKVPRVSESTELEWLPELDVDDGRIFRFYDTTRWASSHILDLRWPVARWWSSLA